MIETLSAKVAFWIMAFIFFFGTLLAMYYEEAMDSRGNRLLKPLSFAGFLEMFLHGGRSRGVEIHRRAMTIIIFNYLTLILELWLLFHLVKFELYLAFLVLAAVARIVFSLIAEGEMTEKVISMVTRARNGVRYALLIYIGFIVLNSGGYWLLVFLNKP